MLQDDTIRRLEDELWSARHAIMNLAPDQFHEVLKGYDLVRGARRTIETRSDLYQWRRDLYDSVIGAAERIERPPRKNS